MGRGGGGVGGGREEGHALPSFGLGQWQYRGGMRMAAVEVEEDYDIVIQHIDRVRIPPCHGQLSHSCLEVATAV